MEQEIKQMFEVVINKLDGMDTRLDNIDSRLGNMDTRLGNMDTRLDNMDTRLDNMDTRLDNMNSRLGTMDIRLDHLEIRQDEMFKVVKAIEHSNNVHKSEIDNLQYKVARTEGIFNKIGNAINDNKVIG